MTNSQTEVPDILRPHLQILFCGINPGLRSAATGHHFARPGNKFWKALYLSGLTPELLTPAEQRELLQYGLGITNLVARASATAAVLSASEYISGARELENKVRVFTPHWLAVLGIEAYKKGFSESTVTLGYQSRTIGTTKVWLLPNPSGLNAHYSVEDFARLLRELKQAAVSQ